MNKKLMLCASDLPELKAQLANLDIAVPRRSEGRTKQHTERYGAAHLLASLPAEQLAFPLMLTHSDKPDFVLVMAGHEFGIEHTEAVAENVAHADFLRDKGVGPEVYFPLRTTPGEQRKKAALLRKEIEANEPGEGWFGDSIEREWAAAIAYAVREKLPKAVADDFVRYPNNWLLVYDNWRLSNVDYVKAASLLLPLLIGMQAFSVFDTIYVHDDATLCEIELDRPPKVYPVVKPTGTS